MCREMIISHLWVKLRVLSLYCEILFVRAHKGDWAMIIGFSLVFLRRLGRGCFVFFQDGVYFRVKSRR